MKIQIFFNEAFDPSLPMAISGILNYFESVQIKKNQRTRHKNDIQQNNSTKMKTILKKNKIYKCIINKNTTILQKNNKRH